MNRYIVQLRDWLKSLDQREVYRLLAAFGGLLLVIFFGWWYLNRYRINKLQRRTEQINQQRKITQNILTRHALVEQQKAYVDEILAQDKNFKIVEYFESVLRELNLKSFNSKPPIIREEDLNNGYTEIRLDAGFTGINTKQLAELLFKIENNPRVTTKELIIDKSLKSPTIDVTLVIATLQPKSIST